MGNNPSIPTIPFCACCYEGGFPKNDSMVEMQMTSRHQNTPSGDDESYMENHRYMMVDENSKNSNNAAASMTNRRLSCRHDRDDPSSSLSCSHSQHSEMDGSKSMEARSDPSMVRRTNTACERDDVEDVVLGSRNNSGSDGE